MKINTIAVIGSGIMGNGIAQVAATAGYEVSLHDISQAALDNALKTVRHSLAKMVKKERLDAEGADNIFKRIHPTGEINAAAEGADFVVEAVSEDFDLKCRIFDKLDRLAPEETILGSNTSQFSITSLAAMTQRPEQVIGVHFFNPPVMMRLIEVVKGLQTSEETAQAVLEIAKRMQKEVVVCKDSQGFITSRMINLWVNEAERILEEGIASSEDIDKACRLAFNHPMGPFELSDFSGLDTRLMVNSSLEEAFGERFKPTQTLRNFVRAGRLGRKTGRGFYDYTKE